MMPTPSHVTEHMKPARGPQASEAHMNELILAAAMQQEGKLKCAGCGALRHGDRKDEARERAEKEREDILAAMKPGEWVTSTDCADRADASRNDTYKHLIVLERRGLVVKRKDGNVRLWCLV